MANFLKQNHYMKFLATEGVNTHQPVQEKNKSFWCFEMQ